MKKNIYKILTIAIIVILLAFSYFWGGNAPGLQNNHSQTAINNIVTNSNSDVTTQDQNKNDIELKQTTEIPTNSDDNSQDNSENYSKNEIKQPDTTVISENTDLSDENSTSNGVKSSTCTLSIKCNTILNNLNWLSPEKLEIVPPDGIILSERTVTYYEGESVFNILQRETKRNKIHLEFVNTPLYNSAYIEGIANIYEFDCGELSGWVYKVNGTAPNHGCSFQKLQPGDKVEWLYTCNLGKDVGGYNIASPNR